MPSPRRQWTLSVCVAVALVLTGLVGSIVVRHGPLTKEPWGYVFLALAGFGAVATTLLCVVRAHGVDD